MDFEREFDVLVCGGGVAGVAAALQCARAGLNTALVEKTVLLGGLATGGLINWYAPLCDGNGRQVTFGIAEEFLHLSLKYGPGDVPAGWLDRDNVRAKGRLQRYNAVFSPASFVLGLAEAIEKAGVKVWLDTLVCQPVMDGERIVGVEVENKSGRGVLRARCVIDATGDADVAFRAGADSVESDSWHSYYVLEASFEAARNALAHPDAAYLTDPSKLHRLSLVEVLRIGANSRGGRQPPGIEKMYGTDAEQVTRFVFVGLRLLREHYQALYAEQGEFSRHERFPVTLPTTSQIRTTRRIVGQETMPDGYENKETPTSIGLIADWSKSGSVWEVPYGALIPRKVTGLVVAGRCMESGAAWEVTRVIPGCALTGQVAGVAAELALEHNTTPDRLDVEDVQQQLREMGIPFHVADVVV